MDEPLPVPHNDMQWARGRECEDNIHGCSRPFSYGKADQSHSFRTSVRSFELKLDMFGGTHFYFDQGNSDGAT